MDPLTRQEIDLEPRLRALAEARRWPPTPDSVAGAVARLEVSAHVPAERVTRLRRASRRRLVVLALVALVVLAAAGAVALGGLPGLRFGFTDVPPSPRVVDDPWRIRASLGRPATLEMARSALGDGLLVPDRFGPPDEVYTGAAAPAQRVALVYLAEGDEVALHGDLGTIITEWGGELFDGYATKWLDRDRGTVEAVTVRGVPGFWFSGMPHVLEYLDVESGIRRPMTRLVGNVLVWQDAGIVYRIETAGDLAGALETAETMR